MKQIHCHLLEELKKRSNIVLIFFFGLKALPIERRQSLNYLQISKSKAMKCLIFAHANAIYFLTIPSMNKISPH